MPLPFNRTGRGLLGYLDAKTRGQMPQALEDNVRGVIDFSDFHKAANTETLVGATGAITGAGFWHANNAALDVLQVPQDELWLVQHISVGPFIPWPAGTTYWFGPAFEAVRFGSSIIVALFEANQQSGPGAHPQHGSHVPFFLLPGDFLGVQAISVALGTATGIRVTVRITRCKI